MIILKEEITTPSFIQRLMYLYVFLSTERKKKEMHCSLATNISTLEIQQKIDREIRETKERM